MNVKEKVEINGEILKKARESKGLKQDELAKLIFTTRQSISNWETGKKIPTLENTKRLAEILEIPFDDLIVRNNDESNLEDITVDEETSVNNIDYTLVYDKTAERKFPKLNFKKIISIVILIILFIFVSYIFSSVRKIIILVDINNKRKEFENVDNYYFTIINTEYENDIIKNTYKEEGYYLKNNLKVKTSKLEKNEITIEYILDNIYYYIDLKDKKYIMQEFDETSNVICNLNNKKDIGKIIEQSAWFNYKIINSDYYYYILYRESIDGINCSIEEKVNKKSGMMEQRNFKYDNSQVTNEYYIEKNSVKDSDLELINLDEYIKKEVQDAKYGLSS